MLYLDAYFRFSGITMMILMTVILFRDGRHLTQCRFGILVTISGIAFLLRSAPQPLLLPDELKLTLAALNSQMTIFLWWLLLSLLEDDFKLRRWHWAVFFFYFLAGIPNFKQCTLGGGEEEPISFAIRLTSVGLIAVHLLYKGIKERENDLVEERRNMRVIFVIITSLYLLANLFVELKSSGNCHVPHYNAFTSFMYLFLSFWSVLWLTHLCPEAFLFQKRDKPLSISKTAQLSPKEQLLHDRLIEAIVKDEAFREQGLTIRLLSEKVMAPEHQLRALINKSMGYRNFSAFLNEYRIKAAQNALSDKENTNLPILTIAMDVGYNSLAPFNRAFRDLTDQTPTAFRHEALKQ